MKKEKIIWIFLDLALMAMPEIVIFFQTINNCYKLSNNAWALFFGAIGLIMLWPRNQMPIKEVGF